MRHDGRARCCSLQMHACDELQSQQLNTLGAVRISHHLWRRCFGKPKLVDLIVIAYSPYEVRPALAPARMQSFERLAFVIRSLTFWEVFFVLF